MSLNKLTARPGLVVIGINSGTSADGLDLVAVRISRTPHSITYRFVDNFSVAFPADLRRGIHQLADSSSTTLDDVIFLDNCIGKITGRAAAKFISRLKTRRVRVDLIASHGQTVRHRPAKIKLLGQSVNGTLQLGSLDQIAAATGCVTVGNFRQADIALGGEGAPITVAAMEQLFGGANESRLVINIGGMANYFYFPLGKNKSIRAADCGPGNVLCDLMSNLLFHAPYDKNGYYASKGQVSTRLTTMLASNPFFRGTRRSTGREDFGEQFSRQIISAGKKLRLSKFDILATTAELTVNSIVENIAPFFADDDHLHTVYLMGGGAYNQYFVRRLTDMLYPNDVASVAALGFDPQYVEASAYAVMGEAALRGEPLPTEFNSDKSQELWPVLGHIVQPPQRISS